MILILFLLFYLFMYLCLRLAHLKALWHFLNYKYTGTATTHGYGLSTTTTKKMHFVTCFYIRVKNGLDEKAMMMSILFFFHYYYHLSFLMTSIVLIRWHLFYIDYIDFSSLLHLSGYLIYINDNQLYLLFYHDINSTSIQ